jgi:putative hydrolase of the HAD superfamily
MLPVLVFDADDTLWDEQGLLQQFEVAIEARLEVSFGRGQGFRQRFIEMEEENIGCLGYGFSSYLFSLAETLAADPSWGSSKAEILPLVAELVASIHNQPPRVIDSVLPTLQVLADRGHRLALLTRGCDHEQRAKLSKSGLAGYFADVLVVASKDVETYRRAARTLGDPSGAAMCMIGNSMRSDILPAIAAGWQAIHVPAPLEWAHDQQAYSDDARFRRVEAFGGVAELVLAPEFWRR